MSEAVGNHILLAKEITALSASDRWPEARLEWDLLSVYQEEEPQTCLCGHTPIIEICVIRNRNNGNEAVVGNVCVNKFLGLNSEKIFAGLRRVGKDDSKALNEAATLYAFDKGWI